MFIQAILPLKLPFEPTYEASGCVCVGDYVRVPLGKQSYIGVVSAVDTPSAKGVKPVTGVLSKLPSESPDTVAFWRRMADYYMCTVGEVFKCARPASRLEDTLKEIERNERKASDDAFKRQVRLSALIDRSLTLEMRETRKEEQLAKARTDASRSKYASELDSIRKSIRDIRDEMDALRHPAEKTVGGELALELKEFAGSEAERVSPFLVPGRPAVWTGASMDTRTATYAELANRMLQQGKSSLVLLPETFRTKRMQETLKGFIPEVLVFDGSITSAQQRKVLDRIRDGRPYVLVGSRSAVLLPHSGLGLVIVDDEHDVSYKQESPAPRYNARDMAVLLSGKDVPVLLASPFPSMETVLNVRCGKYAQVGETSAGNRCLVVDTYREMRKRGMADILSRKLIHEVNQAVAAGRRAVVMVPRKAYSPLLRCPECKEAVTCPECGGYLMLERTGNGLVTRCGSCGKTGPYAGKCDRCGAELRTVGAGLGRCEELIRMYYPELSVATVDGDVPEKEQAALLAGFSEGRVDVLVGTQVVQKAFDCGNIGCIGVLDVDRWFTGMDFRVDERAVQLLGRLRDMVAPCGVLVLQTSDSSRPAMRWLDTEGYYVSEDDEPVGSLPDAMLEERRLASYPPYTRVLDIRVTDFDAVRRKTMVAMMRSRLAKLGLMVIGPFGKPLPGEGTTSHIQVNLPRDQKLGERKRMIRETLDAFEKENKYHGFISVDVDPV